MFYHQMLWYFLKSNELSPTTETCGHINAQPPRQQQTMTNTARNTCFFHSFFQHSGHQLCYICSAMLNLKYIYGIIFISLSAWVIYAYVTTTEIIQSQEIYAHIINISGKQRMLSQKTTLIAKRYYETGDEKLKAHLIELYRLMKKDHREIANTHLTSEQITDIYYKPPINLNKKVEDYLNLVARFIESKDQKTLKEMEAASFELLPQINQTVYIFEQESNEKTHALMQRELFILIGTLLTLVIEAAVIVIPAIRIASRKDSDLRRLIEKRTRELERLSVTDQLTKLYNRRKIDKFLETEIEQARRYNQSFSLILIDIDYFKKINDNYGHLVGDRVLQALSKLFSSNIRKTDMVGRWGGEEFLIISLEKDPEKVLIFVEKLRALVDNHHFKTVDNITCSFGVAHFTEGDTVDSLLRRTDVALYEAKKSGRNCVKTEKSKHLFSV